MDRLGALIRGAITLIILLIAAWWLIEVARRIGTAPIKDEAGNIVLDPFQRAKDILLAVFPLVTTALGYWFGVQGKDKAEERADKAKEKFEAVAVAATPEVLEKAKELYPKAFS